MNDFQKALEKLGQFKLELGNLEQIQDEKNYKKFRAATAKSVPLFIKGRDQISGKPQAKGYHEEDVEGLLKYLSQNGFSDFLIDIGANIGLTTCLAGHGYKNIFCFEPNKLVYRILETNVDITYGVPHDQVRLFPIALGESSETDMLKVPLNNFGAAFIERNNRYDSTVLANLVDQSGFDSKNSFDVPIEMREAKSVLLPIFKELASSGLRHGVIKVDVEGYEIMVVNKIIESLPKDFVAVLVFENHDKNLSLGSIRQGDKKCKFFLVTHKQVRGSKVLRYLKSKLLNAKHIWSLRPIETNEAHDGVVVMAVES